MDYREWLQDELFARWQRHRKIMQSKEGRILCLVRALDDLNAPSAQSVIGEYRSKHRVEDMAYEAWKAVKE